MTDVTSTASVAEFHQNFWVREIVLTSRRGELSFLLTCDHLLFPEMQKAQGERREERGEGEEGEEVGRAKGRREERWGER